MQAQQHILVVDDEAKLADGIARALVGAGFSAEVSGSAEDAYFALHARRPDLLILDVALPRRSGMELLAQLRNEGQKMPVLLLTSHNETEDRVRGLEAGADDYLGKPFALPELLARTRALLRRSGMITPSPVDETLAVGDLRLAMQTRTATRGEHTLELTAREFDLLVYLAEQKGSIATREMLARNVWHETARYTPLTNVIDVQIGRLRRKLDDPFATRLLHTVRGLGFALREEQ